MFHCLKVNKPNISVNKSSIHKTKEISLIKYLLVALHYVIYSNFTQY